MRRSVLFCASLLLVLTAVSMCADDVGASISSISVSQKDDHSIIDIGFSHSIADDDATALKRAQAALIRVVDVTAGSVVDNFVIDSVSGGTLSLRAPLLKEGDLISIIILNLTFGGKNAKKPLTATASVPRVGQKAGGKAPSSSGPLAPGAWAQAKGKDDANIYVATQINAAIDADPTYSVDAKLDIPFRRFIIGKRVQNTGLKFTTAISDAPKADPDSMIFGLFWRSFIWDCGRQCSGKSFRRLQWRNAFQSESNKDFSNTNIVWPATLRLISKTWGSSAEFGIRPYIGNELGFNINSPLPQLENHAVDRPLIGLNTLLLIPTEVAFVKSLSWETLYERRWPLRRELVLKENNDGTLKSIDFGTAPRDYLKSSVTAGFPSYFGLTFSFEYGQLPPSFKLIDDAFKVELTFKAKRKGED